MTKNMTRRATCTSTETYWAAFSIFHIICRPRTPHCYRAHALSANPCIAAISQQNTGTQAYCFVGVLVGLAEKQRKLAVYGCTLYLRSMLRYIDCLCRRTKNVNPLPRAPVRLNIVLFKNIVLSQALLF